MEDYTAEMIRDMAFSFCPQCGTAIVPNHKGRPRKFCSPECRSRWNTVSDFGRAGRSDHPAVQVQPAFELPSLYGSGAHGNAADDRLRIHAGAEHRQRKRDRDDRTDQRVAGRQIPVHPRQVDSVLGNRIRRAVDQFRIGMARLRARTGGQPADDLRRDGAVRADRVGPRPARNEHFRHDAAGNVRDVLFHDRADSDERTVHPDQ